MNVCMTYKCYNMIEHTSERIDIDKANASKKCYICHYWYILDKTFKYELYLCNAYHDLTQKVMNSNDVTIVFVKGSDNRIHFWHMSKDDAINITKNYNLNEKSGLLYIFLVYKSVS